MDILLIAILVGVSVIMLGSSLRRPGGIFEFPFLAGATFLGFVAPELPGLAQDRFLPPGAFATTVSFTIGCAAMCLLGWRAGTRPLRSMQRAEFDERRVAALAAGLSLLGAFFFYKLSLLPDHIKYETQPSGIATVYLFLGDMVTYGLALALLSCARRPSKLALATIAFDLLLMISRILLKGQREGTAQLALIILLTLWFCWKYSPPRIPVLVAVLAASLAIPSVGNYRGLVNRDEHKAPGWSQVSDIPVLQNFETLLANGGDEMRDAMGRISDVDHNQNFDYGLFQWDMLVWNFVPAQFLGSDFKNALIFSLEDQQSIGYTPTAVGDTETGMTDAFASFWYFGVLEFFLVAYLMGRLYRTALSGNFLAQAIYMASITPSMLMITHYTAWIVMTWFKMFWLMVLPLYLFARRRQRRGRQYRDARPVSRRTRLFDCPMPTSNRHV